MRGAYLQAVATLLAAVYFLMLLYDRLKDKLSWRAAGLAIGSVYMLLWAYQYLWGWPIEL